MGWRKFRNGLVAKAGNGDEDKGVEVGQSGMQSQAGDG